MIKWVISVIYCLKIKIYSSHEVLLLLQISFFPLKHLKLVRLLFFWATQQCRFCRCLHWVVLFVLTYVKLLWLLLMHRVCIAVNSDDPLRHWATVLLFAIHSCWSWLILWRGGSVIARAFAEDSGDPVNDHVSWVNLLGFLLRWVGCDASLLEELDAVKLVIDPIMPRMEGNLSLFAQAEQFTLRNLQSHQFQSSSNDWSFTYREDWKVLILFLVFNLQS